MRIHLLALATIALLSPLVTAGGSDSSGAIALIDKAIRALGGQQRLAGMRTVTWRANSTYTVNGAKQRNRSKVTFQGLRQFRQEFEVDGADGGTVKGVSILSGDTGMQRFGDSDLKLDAQITANQSRLAYLTIVPITMLPLKTREFLVSRVPDAKVNGKLVAGIRAIGPDKKDFRLYFDRQTGLPVRLVAKIALDSGEAVLQETTYSDYKTMAGIRKATHISTTRDGFPFAEHEISDFATLRHVEPEKFTSTK